MNGNKRMTWLGRLASRVIVPGFLCVLVLLGACGRQTGVPADGGASLNAPQGFILGPKPSFDDEGPSAPAGEPSDTAQAEETEEERLARIAGKVERFEPLSGSELETYIKERNLERIREKHNNGEELTAGEMRVLGEDNARKRDKEQNTPPEKPAGKPTTAPQAPKQADWMLRVDDNRTVELGGLTWRFNLYVSMDKIGGTNPEGTYEGKILLTGTVDEAELAAQMQEDADLVVDSLYQAYTTEAVSASMDMVPYDAGEEEAFRHTHGHTAPANQTEKANWMATGTPEMITRFQISITGHDEADNEGWGAAPDTERTAAVPVRILVRGADVEVHLGQGEMAHVFSGTLVGVVK